jgi:restriction endonuclease S subunit
MACAVNEDFVTKKDLYVFKIQDNRLSIWYVLALLNSRLFSYLRVISSATASKDDFGQLTLAELRDLPIPIADISIQNSLGDLAKARQAEGLDGRKSEELDKKLDAMVYSLFSLTKAEVEEVESTILGV